MTLICAKFGNDLFSISKVIGRKTKWPWFFWPIPVIISMVNGDRHSSCLQDFCRLLTQFPSYLQPIVVALPYKDYDVLGFHRTASAKKQTTTDINNCRTSTF